MTTVIDHSGTVVALSHRSVIPLGSGKTGRVVVATTNYVFPPLVRSVRVVLCDNTTAFRIVRERSMVEVP